MALEGPRGIEIFGHERPRILQPEASKLRRQALIQRGALVTDELRPPSPQGQLRLERTELE